MDVKRFLSTWRLRSFFSALNANGETVASWRAFPASSTVCSFTSPTNTPQLAQSPSQSAAHPRWRDSTCETVRTERAELVIVHLEDFQGRRKCWDVAEPVVVQIQLLQKGQILDQIGKTRQKCYRLVVADFPQTGDLQMNLI